jgi:hypothetical protein
MANIGLPNIFINFKTAGTTAITRGQRGVVALIIKDAAHKGANVYSSPSEIPQDFSAYNLKQINLAYMGGIKPPLKLIVFVQAEASTDYLEAQTYLESSDWDYLAIPGIAVADALTIATWIKDLRDAKDIKVKAVLPNTAADHEGVINFATDNFTVSGTNTMAKDYCSRIAGILAGTPLDMSATYAVLSEVSDCPHLTVEQYNTQIAAGNLLLINDGTKVKIARAVNSLQTIASTKNDSFKKIKIVDIMDQIHDDIKATSNDSYVGKVPNTYDNKVLLIAAIQGYLDGLVSSMLIDENPVVRIDVNAQKNYLESLGVNVASMADQDIKEYNTSDSVFLSSSIKVVDAMENIQLNVTI